MKNTFVLNSKRDFNPFTRALKARCQVDGEVLVRMRNGDYCKVVYRPANEAKFEDESFHLADHFAYWELSGHSRTADCYDLVEFDETAGAAVDRMALREPDLSGLLYLLALRTQLAAEGWLSEERVSSQFGDSPGYFICLTRYDWHGRSAVALTGAAATYHAHAADPSNALEAAREAAELARRAWREFPSCPPSQSSGGGLVARKPRPHV